MNLINLYASRSIEFCMLQDMFQKDPKPSLELVEKKISQVAERKIPKDYLSQKGRDIFFCINEFLSDEDRKSFQVLSKSIREVSLEVDLLRLKNEFREDKDKYCSLFKSSQEKGKESLRKFSYDLDALINSMTDAASLRIKIGEVFFRHSVGSVIYKELLESKMSMAPVVIEDGLHFKQIEEPVESSSNDLREVKSFCKSLKEKPTAKNFKNISDSLLKHNCASLLMEVWADITDVIPADGTKRGRERALKDLSLEFISRACFEEAESMIERIQDAEAPSMSFSSRSGKYYKSDVYGVLTKELLLLNRFSEVERLMIKVDLFFRKEMLGMYLTDLLAKEKFADVERVINAFVDECDRQDVNAHYLKELIKMEKFSEVERVLATIVDPDIRSDLTMDYFMKLTKMERFSEADLILGRITGGDVKIARLKRFSFSLIYSSDFKIAEWVMAKIPKENKEYVVAAYSRSLCLEKEFSKAS